MNFLEAIKDGRRYRRKGQKEWCSAVAQDRLQELLANDWEVEEKKVVVAEEQLHDAIYSADLHTNKARDDLEYMQEFIKQLEKERGFIISWILLGL